MSDQTGEKGIVYLVGAGPGDPGLLTRRGEELLRRAEVVLYDRLAAPGLLELAPDSCEKISVGKRVGVHTMRQDEINALLVEKALTGKRIVRLKGGDPFVFGRGGEEIRALEAAGIPYEVIPGVTSAVAALETAGIPVTHRRLARSFHVITGHTMEEGVTDQFGQYAALEGTLVFLMGIGHLDRIVGQLLACGKPADTPAAIVERGTTVRQRRLDGTLGTILEIAVREKAQAPGIFVVGEAAAFHMHHTARPLSHIRIGITGTEHMVSGLCAPLRELGACVYPSPCLKLRDTRVLEETGPDWSTYDWLVFTSPNGVRSFFRQLRRMEQDVRVLAGARFAVIGKGTADALWKYGFCADYMPRRYTVQDLARGLLQKLTPQVKVCVLRARDASDDLQKVWDSSGIVYDDLGIYESVIAEQQLQALHEEAEFLDYLTFESASGVRAYFDSMAQPDAFRGTYLCIGCKTAQTLESRLSALPKECRRPVLTADVQTAEGMIKKLIEDCTNHATEH